MASVAHCGHLLDSLEMTAESHMRYMLPARIYCERKALNARVAAALQAPGGGVPATAPDLAPALTELKANLAAEMRAVSEEHFLLLRLLLSPTQVSHGACFGYLI